MNIKNKCFQLCKQLLVAETITDSIRTDALDLYTQFCVSEQNIIALDRNDRKRIELSSRFNIEITAEIYSTIQQFLLDGKKVWAVKTLKDTLINANCLGKRKLLELKNIVESDIWDQSE